MMNELERFKLKKEIRCKIQAQGIPFESSDKLIDIYLDMINMKKSIEIQLEDNNLSERHRRTYEEILKELNVDLEAYEEALMI